MAESVAPEASPAPVELPIAAVVDLGSDPASRHALDGFSMPERVGSRSASWSEGDVSSVSLHLRGGASQYLVAFVAEPYHMLGELSVGVGLNRHALGEIHLSRGWRAYQVAVRGDRVVAGRNQLSFNYSKTARPSDFDPQSSDVRPLSVRFDVIQIAPVTERVQLQFGSKDALGLSALGEGWARDPNDRGTGTWTVAPRAQLSFRLVEPPPTAGRRYRLSLTARSPSGVAERRVALSLNGTSLGSLAYSSTKTTAAVDVAAEQLKAVNELSFEFEGLESPAQRHAESNDTRLLGLRVFELVVAPHVPSASSAVSRDAVQGPAVNVLALEPPASGTPVAEAAGLK